MVSADAEHNQFQLLAELLEQVVDEFPSVLTHLLVGLYKVLTLGDQRHPTRDVALQGLLFGVHLDLDYVVQDCHEGVRYGLLRLLELLFYPLHLLQRELVPID